MKLTLLLLALLCVPASSQAQSLKLPTTVFASAAVADWTGTYVNTVRYGMQEGNPAINSLQSRPALMVAAGAAMDVAGVTVWNRYVGRKHPRLAAVGLYVAAAGRIYLVVHNYKVGQDLKYGRAHYERIK